MKEKLTVKELIIVSSMLFGMFFGAENLIFPVYMGQLSGNQLWPAIIGFILTGVGLPVLSVIALGISQKESLFELSQNIGSHYAIFFTSALYLTIGPFFAIPRCATVSFTIGATPLLKNGGTSLMLTIFALCFFIITFIFSLHPGKILT